MLLGKRCTSPKSVMPPDASSITTLMTAGAIGSGMGLIGRDSAAQEVLVDHKQCLRQQKEKEHKTGSCTNLHAALSQGCDSSFLLQLINSGCDVNAVNQRCRRALHIASARGCVACVRTLLRHGAEVDAADADGLTPLMVASCQRRHRIVDVLLAAGASVGCLDARRQTALHCAVTGRSEECVETLLRAKAKVNYKDRENTTALMLASKLGSTVVVQRLLDSHAHTDILDQFGRTALHWATETGNEACAQALVDAGCDLDIQDGVGETAFVKALQRDDMRLMHLFVEAGCDRTIIDGLNGTALVLAASKGHDHAVDLLLRAGEDPDERGYFGTTPLMVAAFESRVNIVQLLLGAGADPNMEGGNGATPLTKSLYNVGPENERAKHTIVASLLRANADTNYRVRRAGFFTVCTNGRNCPLAFAVRCGYVSLVRMLLVAGARIGGAEIESWARRSEVDGYFNKDDVLAPIRDWQSRPMSLQQQARLVVRHHLVPHCFSAAHIATLPVATPIKKYLMFEEFDLIMIERATVPNDVKQDASLSENTGAICTMLFDD